MLKSVTGIWTTDRGFTLLEVLVTLALMGILTGVAVLSVSGLSGQDQRVEREVQRLAVRLEHHRDEAVLLGETRGLWLMPDRYQFLRRSDEADWQALGAEHRLPSEWESELRVEGRVIKLDPDAPPLIWLTASGEINPFELTLHGQLGSGIAYQISADLLGHIVWESLP